MAGRSGGASSVGMMEGAFFVSRTELTAWVNGLLEVNISKVEQCANGAIYCQIADACRPGSVAMRKVNWMAKSDHEFIPNYKVLQQSFDRCGIEKYIEVDKLIRGKYQDNLEFLQWMKCLWDRENVAGGSDYDPHQAREGKPVPPWARNGAVAPSTGAPRPGEKENFRPTASEGGKRPGAAPASRPGTAGPAAAAARPRATTHTGGSGYGPAGAAAQEERPTSAAAAAAQRSSIDERRRSEELQNQLDSNRDELEDLRCAMEQVEKERDYYFRQLRDVEILCQTLQSNMPAGLSADQLVTDVMGILYAEGGDEDELNGEQQDPVPVR